MGKMRKNGREKEISERKFKLLRKIESEKGVGDGRVWKMEKEWERRRGGERKGRWRKN